MKIRNNANEKKVGYRDYFCGDNGFGCLRKPRPQSQRQRNRKPVQPLKHDSKRCSVFKTSLKS